MLVAPALCAAICVILAAPSPCSAETVYLRDGNIITGKVLVQKAEFIALDLGFTVLEIPAKQIERIEQDKPAEQQAAPAAEARPEAKQGQLYQQAKLKTRTVKELAAEFGEGIVLIRTPAGLGSGFVIDPDGYLMSNAHVIQGETDISVTLFLKEGDRYSHHKIKNVEIVAVNPFVDLALLKMEPPKGLKLTPLNFGDMETVRTGDPVFAIGNPLGFERTVSEGIVSTKARAWEGIVLIQTTAPINPGNSGGPLLNMHGEVIGVTNMKIGFIAEGMGFAVPINFVKDFLEFREAFAYDKDNPNTGNHYLPPPNKPEQGEAHEDAKGAK